jgi:hypothetical protein
LSGRRTDDEPAARAVGELVRLREHRQPKGVDERDKMQVEIDPIEAYGQAIINSLFQLVRSTDVDLTSGRRPIRRAPPCITRCAAHPVRRRSPTAPVIASEVEGEFRRQTPAGVSSLSRGPGSAPHNHDGHIVGGGLGTKRTS